MKAENRTPNGSGPVALPTKPTNSGNEQSLRNNTQAQPGPSKSGLVDTSLRPPKAPVVGEQPDVTHNR